MRQWINIGSKAAQERSNRVLTKDLTLEKYSLRLRNNWSTPWIVMGACFSFSSSATLFGGMFGTGPSVAETEKANREAIEKAYAPLVEVLNEVVGAPNRSVETAVAATRDGEVIGAQLFVRQLEYV